MSCLAVAGAETRNVGVGYMCIDGAFADKELVRVWCKSGVPRATDSVTSCNIPLAVWDMAKNAASHG